MKARKLIDGATYDPETLQVLAQAFEEAWSQISHHFDGSLTEEARLRLAHAVLAVGREDSRDRKEVKNAALQVMAMTYREIRQGRKQQR